MKKLRSIIVRLKRRLFAGPVDRKKLINVCVRLPDNRLVHRYFKKETLIFTLMQSLALTLQTKQEHLKIYRNNQLISEREKITDYNFADTGCLNLVSCLAKKKPSEIYICQGIKNKNINQVNLYHMRKAGGTSLRHYVNFLSESKSIETKIVEAKPIIISDYFSGESRKLFITSLRDPVQRIKSLYLYEGRWPQAAAVRRIEEARSFDQWVEEISEKRENVNELWSCVSNYYIKSLIGYPEYGAEGIDDREYQLACEVLMKFDIVLITEWMSNEATFKYLSKTLSFDYHMPSLVHPTRAKSPEENTSRLFDLKTIQKITQDNYWDCQLYSFAKQLAEERFSSCQQV